MTSQQAPSAPGGKKFQHMVGTAVAAKLGELGLCATPLSEEQVVELGQAAIGELAAVARRRLPKPKTLEGREFSFITPPEMKAALAQIYYRTRWLYKLGLALRAEGDEAKAHVRVQLIDYGAICEELLRFAVRIGVSARNINCLEWTNARKNVLSTRPGLSDLEVVEYIDFDGLIKICKQAKITQGISKQLRDLKNLRNSVHVAKMIKAGAQYKRLDAKTGKDTVESVIAATRAWSEKLEKQKTVRPPKVTAG